MDYERWRLRPVQSIGLAPTILNLHTARNSACALAAARAARNSRRQTQLGLAISVVLPNVTHCADWRQTSSQRTVLAGSDKKNLCLVGLRTNRPLVGRSFKPVGIIRNAASQ